MIALEPRTRQEEVVYKEAVEICIDMGSNRALIEAASGQSLSAIEWSGLLLLLLLLTSLIAVLPGGTLWGALVAGVMAGTLVTLIVLLRKLDRLRWHERTSIWEPTARLFRSIGEGSVRPSRSHRIRPVPTRRPTRVADYVDPYPNRTRKLVTVEDFGQVDGPNCEKERVRIDRAEGRPGLRPADTGSRSTMHPGRVGGSPGRPIGGSGSLALSCSLSKRLSWAGRAVVLPLRGRQHGT